MHEVTNAVLEWIPTWADDPTNAYRGAKAIVNVGAVNGGFGWRVSRTPHHTDLFLDVRVPPTKEMAVARREVLEWVRSLAERFPDWGVEGEVDVAAPGAESGGDHDLGSATERAHEAGGGAQPRRRGQPGACATSTSSTSIRAPAAPAATSYRAGTRLRAHAAALPSRALSATPTRSCAPSACASPAFRRSRSTTRSSSRSE